MTHDPGATLERMRACLCRWQEAGDGRAVFLGCYAMMTDNMVAALTAGEFEDPGWVRHLLVHFAGYYFDALDAWEAGDAALSPVWRCAHEAACHPGSAALAQLLLGVNAHINYDLVLATADMLDEEWLTLTPDGRERRRSDFYKVNTIIGRTIDAVQDTILEPREPFLSLIDAALGPVDEWLVQREIARWRDEVWSEAVRRVEMPDSSDREAQRLAVEAAALHRARLLGAL